MAERFKAHAWKACVPKQYRGFESLSLRHSQGHQSTRNSEAIDPALNFGKKILSSSVPIHSNFHFGAHVVPPSGGIACENPTPVDLPRPLRLKPGLGTATQEVPTSEGRKPK